MKNLERMGTEKPHRSSDKITYTRYNVENTLGKTPSLISVSAKMKGIVEREFGKIKNSRNV